MVNFYGPAEVGGSWSKSDFYIFLFSEKNLKSCFFKSPSWKFKNISWGSYTHQTLAPYTIPMPTNLSDHIYSFLTTVCCLWSVVWEIKIEKVSFIAKFDQITTQKHKHTKSTYTSNYVLRSCTLKSGKICMHVLDSVLRNEILNKIDIKRKKRCFEKEVSRISELHKKP